MSDLLTYIFGLFGLLALLVVRRLDNRCVDCQNNNIIFWVVGVYLLLVFGGRDNFRYIVKVIADGISNFSISFKKEDDKRS